MKPPADSSVCSVQAASWAVRASGRGKLIADCRIGEFVAGGTAEAAVVRTSDGQRLAEVVAAVGGALERAAGGEMTVHGLSAERVGQLALANGIGLTYLAPARVSLEEAFMEPTAESTEFEARTEG